MVIFFKNHLTYLIIYLNDFSSRAVTDFDDFSVEDFYVVDENEGNIDLSISRTCFYNGWNIINECKVELNILWFPRVVHL